MADLDGLATAFEKAGIGAVVELVVARDGDVRTVGVELVALGERQDDGTIVVREGLDGTERYVVRGLQKARPGSTVSPSDFVPARVDAEADVDDAGSTP